MNRARDRLAGATIAVMLQLGLVTIFIYSLPLVLPVKKRVREITFFLPPPREAARPASGPRRDRPSSLPSPAAPPAILPPMALPPTMLRLPSASPPMDMDHIVCRMQSAYARAKTNRIGPSAAMA
jgi:hypothetical protein